MIQLSRATRLVALAIALLFVPAPRVARAQENVDKPVLRGVVVDEATRVPVSAAAVQLLDENGKRLLATIADAQGRFQITLPAPGNYKLRVNRLGYFQRESPAFAVTIPVLNMEFQVSPHPVVLDSVFVAVKSEARKLGVTEQLIHGRLLDDATRAPIPAGTVILVNAGGKKVASAITDSYGLFRLVTPTPGAYRLRAERIGYKSAEGPELKMIMRDTVRLDFFLSTEAVLMAPILVTGTARDWRERYDEDDLGEVYSRMRRFGAAGEAEFILRDSLLAYERDHVTTKAIIDRHSVRQGRGCNSDAIPDVYVNGGAFNTEGIDLDDLFPPGSLQALEIFISPQIPAEFLRGLFRPEGDAPKMQRVPCKVIVLWTRR